MAVCFHVRTVNLSFKNPKLCHFMKLRKQQESSRGRPVEQSLGGNQDAGGDDDAVESAEEGDDDDDDTTDKAN